MRCLTALFVVVGCLVATQAMAERRVALVVGNSRYTYATPLPNPRNDAEDIANMLAQVGFEVKVGYDLDQIRFARLIEDFAGALEGADVGLFFYAGHGLQINEKNYLVSTEAKLESTFLVPSETIELDAVIRLMESKTATNLVFLDACRNNPLADNLKRNLASTNRAITVGRGLAPVAAGRDTLVAYSAAPGKEAADGRGRNSPFAASLLRHLPQPGLEVSVMLKEVTADVRRETDNGQSPEQLSSTGRPFYFVKAEPALPVAPTAPEPDPYEVAFWQSAIAANECDAIRAYLRKYPGGRFDDLAVIAERRLCKPGLDIALPSLPSAPGVAIAHVATPVDRPPAAAPDGPPAPIPTPAAAHLPPSSVPTPSPTAPGSNVATAPADVLPSATPVPRPLVTPDAVDVGRKLQAELVRVGCAPKGVEADGTWGAAWRNALRLFNERAHAAAVIDHPTLEALSAVQGRNDRVCPLTCEPGTELRGSSCVEVRKERTRPASRPTEHGRAPERDRSPRAQHAGEPPRRADAGPAPPSRADNQKLDPNKGESWFYMGNKRCKTYQPMGETPRIICP